MFTIWLPGEGAFLSAEPKLHEMDRSSLKTFIGYLRGVSFLPTEPQLLEIT